jgi:WD40 repeat protein
MEFIVNKWLTLLMLAVTVTGAQAEWMNISFVEPRRTELDASSSASDRYTSVLVSFFAGNPIDKKVEPTATYILTSDEIRQLGLSFLDRCYSTGGAQGVTIDLTQTFSDGPLKNRLVYPGLSATSFGLIVQFYREGRDHVSKFTATSCDRFLRKMIAGDFKDVRQLLDSKTPFSLGLRLAMVLAQLGSQEPVKLLIHLLLHQEYLALGGCEDYATFRNIDEYSSVFSHQIRSMLEVMGGRLSSHYLIRTYELRDTHTGSTPIGVLACAPDERHIAIAVGNKQINIFNVVTETTEYFLRGHETEISTIVYSPTNKQIASGDQNGVLRLWNTETGAHEHTVTLPARIDHLAYSPDGTHIAIGLEHVGVFLLNVLTAQITRTCDDIPCAITSIAHSSKDGNIAIGGSNGCVYVWNGRTGTRGSTFEIEPTGKIDAVAYSLDGAHILATSSSCIVYTINVETGERKKTACRFIKTPSVIAYSPDRTRVMFGNRSSLCTLHVETGDCHGGGFTGKEPLQSIAYAPDGTHIAVALGNKMVIMPTDPTTCIPCFQLQCRLLVSNAKKRFANYKEFVAATHALWEKSTHDGKIEHASDDSSALFEQIVALIEQHSPVELVQTFLKEYASALGDRLTDATTLVERYVHVCLAEQCAEKRSGASSSKNS